MSEEIRDERTQGLQERLSPAQRSALLQIRYTPGYEAILDVMEMACIEQETRLINVEVDKPETIVAEHRMAKAFWQVFTAVQKKIEAEINAQLRIEEDAKYERQQANSRDEQQETLRP